MKDFGPEDTFVLPTRLVHPLDLLKIQTDASQEPVEKVLEEAFYGFRYNINTLGADVGLRGAGDLNYATIAPHGDWILGKFDTPYGEVFSYLNTDTGFVYSQDVMAHRDRNYPRDVNASSQQLITPVGHFLAEVYRDLVTAYEIPDGEGNYRPLRQVSDLTQEQDSQIPSPEITYIRRVVRSRSQEHAGVRVPYSGPPRPIKPRVVTGHPRRGNMTEKQREAIREWQKEHGMDILSRIRPGYTWVKPFFFPKEAGEGWRKRPKFIRRQLEEQLTKVKD